MQQILFSLFLIVFILSILNIETIAQESAKEKSDKYKEILDGAASPLLAGPNALDSLVIGIIHNSQQYVSSYGDKGENGDTSFKIASVTKPFTALLLTQLEVEGKLDRTEIAFEFESKPVTYQHLVTHTSGLPRLPKTEKITTTQQLRDYLKDYSPTQAPGASFEYSTVGYGALGMAIAQKCGTGGFSEYLNSKILQPLGLSSTRFVDRGKNRENQNPFAPSGGLISSANDLLKLIAANLEPDSCPLLAKAIELSHETYPDIQTFPGSYSGMGWQVMHMMKPIKHYWHSGIGKSFRVFVAFNLKSQTGIVMLTSSTIGAHDPRLEMAGFMLLGNLASASQ